MRAFPETVLYHAAEALRIVVALAHPALPIATAKIWSQLGQPSPIDRVRIDRLAWGQLSPGTHIGEIAAVFPRIEKPEALERISTMEQEMLNPQGKPAATPAAQPAAPSPVAAAAAPAAAAGVTASSSRISPRSRCASARCNRPSASPEPISS